MKKSLHLSIALLSLLLLATGCFEWEHEPQPYLAVTGTYILNGGSAGADASLCGYVYKGKESSGDMFLKANGKSLGAKAEDMLCLNGYFYICATSDKVLYKTDSLGKIVTEIVTPETARSPRHITIYKDHLYVTYAEGCVAEIDTATSAIRVMELGGTPNGIAAAGDKVYIALSGTESTEVAIIGSRTFVRMKSLAVACNPGKMVTATDRLIYLLSNGDGLGNKPVVQVIDSQDDSVYPLNSIRNALDIAAVPGYLVYVLTKGDADRFFVCPIDAALGLAVQENMLSSEELVAPPTSISADPVNGFVYLGQEDASGNGSVKVFSTQGNCLDTFKTGSSAPAGAFFSTTIQYL